MSVLDDAGTIEDQLGIEQLIYQYQHALDSGDGKLFAECFTPGAILPGVNLTWQGDFAQRLQEMHKPVPADRKVTASHYMFNHLYDVSGARAFGVTYCWGNFSGPSSLRDMYVRYRDELVKQDGQWRFQKREFDLLCYTKAIPARRIAQDRAGH